MTIDVIRSKIVIAGLSYVQPVFKADYLQIRVTAEVTMPDVLNVDIVTPVDLVSLSTTKALTDATSELIDSLSRAVSKRFADSVTEVDFAKRSFQKKLVDTQSLTDAKSINFTKFKAHYVFPSDLASLAPVKALADSINTPADAVANVIYKALADSVTLVDVADAVRLYIRTFSDSLATPDLYKETFTPKTKADSASAFDNSRLEATKVVSEGLSAIDNMDGDLTYAFIKVIGELISGVDLQRIDFNTKKADNIATTSSGILSMQDYSDITYFLEDYVGLSRTFT
jgi:hypothetical protein